MFVLVLPSLLKCSLTLKMSEKYAQMGGSGGSGDGMKTGDDKVKDVAEAWERLKVLCVCLCVFVMLWRAGRDLPPLPLPIQSAPILT